MANSLLRRIQYHPSFTYTLKTLTLTHTDVQKASKHHHSIYKDRKYFYPRIVQRNCPLLGNAFSSCFSSWHQECQ